MFLCKNSEKLSKQIIQQAYVHLVFYYKKLDLPQSALAENVGLESSFGFFEFFLTIHLVNYRKIFNLYFYLFRLECWSACHPCYITKNIRLIMYTLILHLTNITIFT